MLLLPTTSRRGLNCQRRAGSICRMVVPQTVAEGKPRREWSGLPALEMGQVHLLMGRDRMGQLEPAVSERAIPMEFRVGLAHMEVR